MSVAEFSHGTCTDLIRKIAGASGKILGWFEKYGCRFPWREEANPYRILITEVLLQRTSARSVAKMYSKFFEKYPDVRTLAEAKVTEIKHLIEPLGLKKRAEILHKLAVKLLKDYNGKIPNDPDTLRSLPGVGHYAANATAVFAYGYRMILLDANTVRVFCRITGIPMTDTIRRNKHVLHCMKRLAEAIPTDINIKDLNLSLIDLGRNICRPRKPHCEACPLSEVCDWATKSGTYGDK